MSTSVDARLQPSAAALAALKASKPWQGSPKYFAKVEVSAVAAMKMTQHAAAGVEKGLRAWSPLQPRAQLRR